MRLSKSRRFGLKMGDFETYTFGAEVGMSTDDLGISEAQLVEMSDEEREQVRRNLRESVLQELEFQLEAEVQEAADLTENQQSFILRALKGGSREASEANGRGGTDGNTGTEAATAGSEPRRRRVRGRAGDAARTARQRRG